MSGVSEDVFIKYIVESVSSVLRIPEDSVNLDATFEELEMDSLDSVELLMELDDRTQSEIDPTVFDGCKTLREFINKYKEEMLK